MPHNPPVSWRRVTKGSIEPCSCSLRRRSISARMFSGLGIEVYQSFHSLPSDTAAISASWWSSDSGSSVAYWPLSVIGCKNCMVDSQGWRQWMTIFLLLLDFLFSDCVVAYRLLRDMNIRRSNRCTSCSFFSNAPCKGGMAALPSLLCKVSAGISSASNSLSQSISSDVDGLLHRVLVRKLDVVEEAAAQESVRQFLLVVRGDDDQRPVLCAHHLARFVDVEFHPVDFAQQVVGEFDVGFVDLIDQQDLRLVRGKGLPQHALDDVVVDVLDAFVAKLRVAQT